MTDLNALESIYFAALKKLPAERSAFLATACGANADLRARVERLLAVQPNVGGFLQAVAATVDLPSVGRTASFGADAPASVTADYANKDEHVGSILGGKYKLIEAIGEGGMGSVYMALQTEPVKRAVAVKVIKAGMDSKAVLARFEAERQALAMMDHPNIARVLDAGTTESGRPYFVMELVKGVPITQFCDDRKLTPRQRLEMFVPVCNAIQHAHQKGIIHRDIKPSNVLVAMYDDRPVPKVIDFGVAKAAGQALTDKTLMTGFGAVVGTPEYMSPEQANLNNLDIDTRSDVYSLGVLLYELLTGTTPVDRKSLDKAALLEILRIVREVEAPKPSLKLSSSASLPSVAANRNTEPAKLSKLMKGELDWVLLKALDKDRTRRYESANGFAADVNRYLADEVVEARPPSTGYRFKKFVKRHKARVTAAGLVVVALLAGIAGTTWGLFEAKREQAKTKDALDQSEQNRIQAERNRDQAEVNLVQSFLRPIGFNTDGVDPAELIALNELSQQDDRIKLLFLRDALADGERSLRIARSVERVVQSTVGPSPKRRAEALELTGAMLRNKDADPRCRLAASWIAIELGSEEIGSIEAHFETLFKQKNITDLNNFLDRLPDRIAPSQRMRLFDAYAKNLGKAMVFESGIESRDAVQNGLLSLNPIFDRAKSNEAAKTLAIVLGKTDNWYASVAIGNSLVNFAPRIDSETLKLVADAMIAFLGNPMGKDELNIVGSYLVAFAPRLDPATAKIAFDALVALQGKPSFKNTKIYHGQVMAALASRLDPSATKTEFDNLVTILSKTKTTITLNVARESLAALASRLDPDSVKIAFNHIVTVLEKTGNPSSLYGALLGIKALAPQLDPAMSKKAAVTLMAVLGKKTTENSNLHEALPALVALAPQLDSATAKMVFDSLVVDISKLSNIRVSYSEQVLAALASRLDPAMSKEAAITLVADLGKKTTEKSVLEVAIQGLVALAPQLDPVTAKAAFDSLVLDVVKVPNLSLSYSAEQGLAALAPQLDPATAKAAFDTVLPLLENSTDKHDWEAVGNILIALAPRLDPASIKTAADDLIEVLGKSRDKRVLDAAAKGLAALAPRLDKVAAKSTAMAFVEFLGKTKGELSYSVQVGLTAIAPQLDPAATKLTFNGLIEILCNSNDDNIIAVAGVVLEALAPRIDPVTLKEAANILIAYQGNSTNGNSLYAAGYGLAVLAPRVDTATAKIAFHSLLTIFGKTKDYSAQNTADLGLAELALRLESTTIQESTHTFISAYQLNTMYNANKGLQTLLSRINSMAGMAELLHDPACHGITQDNILWRMEELAFPQPAHAGILIGLGAAPIPAMTISGHITSDLNVRKQNRRFRTVSDAAKWIAEHHPEIDLDRPYRNNASK